MTESKRDYLTPPKRRLDRRQREEKALLLAMRRGIAYGYDLSRVTRIRPGRLYPALGRLEADGRIVGRFEEGPEPRRRFYKIAKQHACGTLGALRELTDDLSDSTPIVVVTRKAHDLDHFYAEVPVECEQVDLTHAPVVVLTTPEPEDFDE